MTEAYTRLAGFGAAAMMAAALAACGGEDVQRAPAEDPAYEEAGRTPPSMVAGPERQDDAGARARDDGDDVDGATPGTPDRVATGTGVTEGAGAGATERPGAGATPAPATPPAEAPPASPAAPSAESTDAILRATARTYEGVRSLRAGFDQRMRNPLLGRETTSSGTLYQRQPDRFLMEFSDPDGDVIVSDGEFFWLYYPSVDARQVIRAPRGPQGLDLHAQFIGDPVRRFEATSHGRESVRGRSAHVLTLVPREPLGYRSLKVWIDTDDHLVRRFELTEENGNVRRFELRDLVVNPSLPDRLFQFTPPAGAQVIQRG